MSSTWRFEIGIPQIRGNGWATPLEALKPVAGGNRPPL